MFELFFKWLKTFTRMDHLLSTSRNGITFQLYVAVIAVLMMYVQSGRRVSIYALAALSRLARGQCTPDEAMAVIERRERERELNRLRQARLRARKKLAGAHETAMRLTPGATPPHARKRPPTARPSYTHRLRNLRHCITLAESCRIPDDCGF